MKSLPPSLRGPLAERYGRSHWVPPCPVHGRFTLLTLTQPTQPHTEAGLTGLNSHTEGTP